MNILLKNAKALVQILDPQVSKVCGKDMQNISCLEHAYLMVKGDRIYAFGPMSELDESIDKWDTVLDVSGKFIFPTFCDSHTHIVYAGSREIEYMDKIKGLSYEEIAKRGGGILNSAKRLAQTTEEDLYYSAKQRLDEMAAYGTGAVEIKSGYGLNTENELKMLRVIKKLKQNSLMTIKSNFLGAHGVPMEYRGRQSEYVDLIVNEMIPAVAAEELADFVDVFCDKGFFTVEDTEKILEAGARYGMRPKIHANELDFSGGVQVGVKFNALSVDHLEFIGEAEINALLHSQTMPTVLPGAAFFLEMQLSPVRKMMEAGLPIAMASDFNPGSSPSGNMQFVQSLACIKYKMYPEEAIHATTINTAYAMGIEKELGSISVGKIANLFITKEIPSYHYIPYSYGNNKVETVILKGNII